MRVSTESAYRRVLIGLRTNFAGLVRSQEQVASGLRILRPSDDPTGMSRVLSLERQLADSNRIRSAIAGGLTFVDGAAAALEEGSKLIAEVRSLVLQSMNGTISEQDRAAIGQQISLLRTQMLDIANQRVDNRYLFGGTKTTTPPWSVAGDGSVQYNGDASTQDIRIGSGVTIPINLSGDQIFARVQPAGLAFAGLTGLMAGSTSVEGSGAVLIEVRQDTLDAGALAGVGISVVGDSTLMGSHQLIVDVAAGTIQLGDGAAVALPAAGSSLASGLTLKTASGAKLTLDVSAFTGVNFNDTITATGSIRVGSGPFIALDPTETDLRLEDPASGNVLHLNLTEVNRAGTEMVQFTGQIDIFQLLEGIAGDLAKGQGLNQADLLGRLDVRLSELDRHHGNVLSSLGVLGARSARMTNTSSRFESVGLQVSSLISGQRDADYTEVVLEMRRSESTLQLAQATGVRLIQRSLLDFLR